MDWKQKANYLAQRVRKTGGVWIIWLNGQPVDDPAQLGSTTDADELKDPAYLQLGYYEDRDGKFSADALLLDIEEALGQPPSGTALGPQAQPAKAPKDPPREPTTAEIDPGREVDPDPAAEPNPSDPPEDSPDEGQEEKPAPAPDPAPPEPERQEAAVADDEPSQGLNIPESVEHSIRAKLFHEYTKAHEKGPRGSRDAWKRLIDLFEDEVAG